MNKRFECEKGSRIIIDNETKLHYIMTLDWECRLITKLLNKFVEENEQLKQKIISLDDSRYSYKQDWKQASMDCDVYKDEINSLKDENKGLIEEKEQLQKKINNLVNMTARVQYRADQRKEENEHLKKQLDYIQNIINTHIKHQKTELGQKALQEIIKDYNEWLIGHKGE